MIFVRLFFCRTTWKLALITVAIVMPALTIASLWFRAASEARLSPCA